MKAGRLVAGLSCGVAAGGLLLLSILDAGIPLELRVVFASVALALAFVAVAGASGRMPLVWRDSWGDWGIAVGGPGPAEVPEPCWRCGRLNPPESDKCSSCGASLS